MCRFLWLLIAIPQLSLAQIIWSGDYSTGNFRQWHVPEDVDEVNFHQVPSYGRPIQYGGQNPLHVGDGSLLSLVSVDGRTVNGVFYPVGPTRNGPFAAKFTVKNSRNGSEPENCDGGLCTRRRTELTAQSLLPLHYNAMPYLSERWLSVSHFVPADWDDSGSGWGPIVFQIKPLIDGPGPCFSISIEKGSWTIRHVWSPLRNPAEEQIPWWQGMFYTGNHDGLPYPRKDFWSQGLRDFPDVAASYAALKSLNKGGWTDWIIHLRFDARGAASNGTGWLMLWKRESSGPWVKVLHIVPKITNRGGDTPNFDHGVCYNSPASGNMPGGFGIKVGLYMERNQVFNLPKNRVIYNANIKVGNEQATFQLMSPNGADPPDRLPAPPVNVTVQ